MDRRMCDKNALPPTARKKGSLHMKVKNRKMALHQVNVIIGGRMFRPILVTTAQLAKLDRLPVGKEVFLSRYYCYSGGEFWIIRTSDRLQYLPNPHRGNPADGDLLESLLK